MKGVYIFGSMAHCAVLYVQMKEDILTYCDIPDLTSAICISGNDDLVHVRHVGPHGCPPPAPLAAYLAGVLLQAQVHVVVHVLVEVPLGREALPAGVAPVAPGLAQADGLDVGPEAVDLRVLLPVDVALWELLTRAILCNVRSFASQAGRDD